jgi:hypothetical protein
VAQHDSIDVVGVLCSAEGLPQFRDQYGQHCSSWFGAGGARDPKSPKTAGRLGGLEGLPKVQTAPQDAWKVSWHGLGAAGPLFQPPVLVTHTKPA